MFLEKQLSLIQEIFGSIREVLLYQYQDIYLQDYIKVDKPMRKLGAENIFLASFPKFILESAGLIFITLIAILFNSKNKILIHYFLFRYFCNISSKNITIFSTDLCRLGKC